MQSLVCYWWLSTFKICFLLVREQRYGRSSVLRTTITYIPQFNSSQGDNNCRMNRKSLFVLQRNSDEFIPISSDYIFINESGYTHLIACHSYHMLQIKHTINIYGSIMRTTWKTFGFIQGKVDLEFIKLFRITIFKIWLP